MRKKSRLCTHTNAVMIQHCVPAIVLGLLSHSRLQYNVKAGRSEIKQTGGALIGLSDLYFWLERLSEGTELDESGGGVCLFFSKLLLIEMGMGFVG